MLEIMYDDNAEDIIDKVNKELQQYGIELQERQDENWDRPSVVYEIVQHYSLPDVHDPDCNCRMCK